MGRFHQLACDKQDRNTALHLPIVKIPYTPALSGRGVWDFFRIRQSPCPPPPVRLFLLPANRLEKWPFPGGGMTTFGGQNDHIQGSMWPHGVRQPSSSRKVHASGARILPSRRGCSYRVSGAWPYVAFAPRALSCPRIAGKAIGLHRQPSHIGVAGARVCVL